jgi:hypothetical protein
MEIDAAVCFEQIISTMWSMIAISSDANPLIAGRGRAMYMVFELSAVANKPLDAFAGGALRRLTGNIETV